MAAVALPYSMDIVTTPIAPYCMRCAGAPNVSPLFVGLWHKMSTDVA